MRNCRPRRRSWSRIRPRRAAPRWLPGSGDPSRSHTPAVDLVAALESDRHLRPLPGACRRGAEVLPGRRQEDLHLVVRLERRPTEADLAGHRRPVRSQRGKRVGRGRQGTRRGPQPKDDLDPLHRDPVGVHDPDRPVRGALEPDVHRAASRLRRDGVDAQEPVRRLGDKEVLLLREPLDHNVPSVPVTADTLGHARSIPAGVPPRRARTRTPCTPAPSGPTTRPGDRERGLAADLDRPVRRDRERPREGMPRDPPVLRAHRHPGLDRTPAGEGRGGEHATPSSIGRRPMTSRRAPGGRVRSTPPGAAPPQDRARGPGGLHPRGTRRGGRGPPRLRRTPRAPRVRPAERPGARAAPGPPAGPASRWNPPGRRRRRCAHRTNAAPAPARRRTARRRPRRPMDRVYRRPSSGGRRPVLGRVAAGEAPRGTRGCPPPRQAGAPGPGRRRSGDVEGRLPSGGVDYDVLDAFKRACQKAAARTAANLAAPRLHEPRPSAARAPT